MNSYVLDFDIENVSAREVDDPSTISLSQPGNKKHFSIFHLNIRSINKNFDESLLLLDQLKIDFDIIIFGETWRISDINFFNIDDYQVIYNEGDINQNDGVVVYVRRCHRDFKFEIKKIGDIKIINVILNTNGQRVLVTALYRPHATNPELFNENLRQFLTNQKEQGINYCFFVGDTNIDIRSNKDFSQTYLNVMAEFGFRSIINAYTRIQRGSATCIDHIFVKDLGKGKYESFVIKSDITDHFPIVATLNLESGPDTNNVKSDKILKLNEKKLINTLQNTDFTLFYETNNIDFKAETLISNIQNAVRFSTKEIIFKHKCKKRKPWITQGLTRASQIKQDLFKKHRLDPENIIKNHEYKTYKNKLNKLISLTKLNYFKSKLNETKNDSKTLWNVVNEFTGTLNKTEKKVEEIKIDDKVITDKKEIANCFNKYFTEVGKNLANNIKRPIRSSIKKDYQEHSMYFFETDSTEVSNTIQELKLHKAPGLDSIAVNVLKITSHIISKPISHLINKIFETGYFPKHLKSAVIKPLFKKGNPLDMCNYRPISLISNLSKIVEKIIKKRVVAFLEKFNLLSKNQFGFKKGVSTEDAIVYLTNNIYNNLDKNNVAIGVFLDLAKAFDTVDHVILIDVLEALGFRGVALNIFKSYLQERQQFVQIENVLSEARQVQYGVPQGTVLGPILFSIYINGLLQMQSIGNISSFADDTVIVYIGTSWQEIKQKLQTDLPKIKSWFDEMSLTINFEKTKYVPFSCNKSRNPNFQGIELEQNDQTILVEGVTSIKYLGIYVDRFMKWDIHIKSLVNKLRFILYKFRQLRKILDTPQLKTLYYSLIESHLQYGIAGWGGVYKNNLKSLETLQKRFLKIMYKKERTYPSDLLYTESQVLDIRQIYCLKILILQFKKKTELDIINHGHNTRFKKDKEIYTKRASKKIGQRSCSFLSPLIYRHISLEAKNSTTLAEFKKKVKVWLTKTPRSIINKVIEIS